MELSNLETYMKEFNDAQKAYQEAKEKIGKKLGSELHGMIKFVFEKVPYLKEINWVQYTPYFNDGEPCVFGKHDPQFIFVAIDAETGDDEEFEVDFWGNSSTTTFFNEKYDVAEIKAFQPTPEQDELLLKVALFLTSLDENICQEAFREGKVVITKDGLEVEDYGHD